MWENYPVHYKIQSVFLSDNKKGYNIRCAYALMHIYVQQSNLNSFNMS